MGSVGAERDSTPGKDLILARYSIAALAVFGLLCLWLSVFVPNGLPLSNNPKYGGVDQSAMSYEARVYWNLGAPRGYVFALPIRTNVGLRFERLPTPPPVARPGRSSINWVGNIMGTIALLIAGFLGIRKPGWMMAGLVLFVGGIVPSHEIPTLFAGCPFPVFVSIAILVNALYATFPTLALASFVIRFPLDASTGPLREWQRVIDGIVVAGFLFQILCYTEVVPGLDTFALAQGFVALSAAIVIAATTAAYAYAGRRERGRVALVFIAVIMAGVLYAVATVELFNVQGWAIVFSKWGFPVSTLIIPLAVAYAIRKHRIFDVGFVLNRTLAYAATSALLLVLFGALELLAERVVNQASRAASAWIEFAIAIAVIVSARLIHGRIDRLVDTLFFRSRHQDESSLRRFATTVQFYNGLPALTLDTVKTLAEYGRVHGVALYLAQGDGLNCVASTFEGTPPIVESDDPAYVDLRAHGETIDISHRTTSFAGVRLYPMRLAGRFVGVVSVGERETGETMPPDIDDALRAVATSVAMAVEGIEAARLREEVQSLRLQIGGSYRASTSSA
jgi:hypothetical protein